LGEVRRGLDRDRRFVYFQVDNVPHGASEKFKVYLFVRRDLRRAGEAVAGEHLREQADVRPRENHVGGVCPDERH
jgi:hypothetical protein